MNISKKKKKKEQPQLQSTLYFMQLINILFFLYIYKMKKISRVKKVSSRQCNHVSFCALVEEANATFPMPH